MAIIAKESSSGSFQLAPVGLHIARCVWVVDLGTQDDSFQGKARVARKIQVGWELPEEKAVFKEEKGEEPFFLSKEYTLSLGDKANLRHDLESWRGKQFTEQELEGFDVTNLAGHLCHLNVIHYKKTSGDSGAKISAIAPFSKKKNPNPPEQINPTLVYEIAMLDGGSYSRLPEWLKKKIMASREWKEHFNSGGASQHHEETEPDEEVPEDSIPF